MKIVLVTWRDSHEPTDKDYADLDELRAEHKPAIQESVGFLVKRDKAGIMLAGCICDATGPQRPLFIEASAVKSVAILRR